MFKQKQVIAKAIETLVADVKNFVVLNGGFIATTNGELDTIYAYVVDWDYDDVSEQRVLAVRVKDNELQVAVTPYKTDVYNEPLDEDYFNDNEWYSVGTCGDSILTAQTILSIADSIEQYV
jgi:hypothetical protein